jgi:muconolactone delta-isomerase
MRFLVEQVFLADSPQAVEEIIQSFPLAPYSTHSVIPLADPQAG